jgi:hypothetical protein
MRMLLDCIIDHRCSALHATASIPVAPQRTLNAFHHLLAASVKPAGDGLALQGQVQMIAFCVFEVCVGLFWPSMMKMRATYVPEEMRSTIINYFRIPLNLFVCIVLYNVSASIVALGSSCTAAACRCMTLTGGMQWCAKQLRCSCSLMPGPACHIPLGIPGWPLHLTWLWPRQGVLRPRS